ncbi:MAG: response regulator [Parvibaculaceae bacterium]
MSASTTRVLYVDDDVALARLVQKTLGRRGFDVSHAGSLDDARSMLARDKFDVIAQDHYLPSGTGLDFLAELVAGNSATPVVYVTGTNDMNVAVTALKAGASDFVPKTVGDEFLILLGSALEQAVDKARLRIEKEAAEAEVRAARDRAELLLAEVNHRVANSLAIVSSLVNMQANALTDKVAKEALAETHAQIYAIALVHKRLYSSGEIGVVGLDEYLAGLLDHLRTTLRREGHAASLAYDLAPLKLGTDASINLGIVMTEWVTNAFKYAYPDKPGEIRVNLRRLAEEKAELAVEDDGVGRDDNLPVHGTGLGSRIVKAMATSLNGEIVYGQRRPGTSARLTFPAPSP